MIEFGQAVANAQIRRVLLLHNPLVNRALSEFMEGLAPRDAVHRSEHRLQHLSWKWPQTSFADESEVFALADFLADCRRSQSLWRLEMMGTSLDPEPRISNMAAAMIHVAIHRYNRRLQFAYLPYQSTTESAGETTANLLKACQRYVQMDLSLPRDVPPIDDDHCQDVVAELLRSFGKGNRATRDRFDSNDRITTDLRSLAGRLIAATRILLNGHKDDRFRGRLHLLDLPPEILLMIIRNFATDPDLPSERQWNDLLAYAADRRTLQSEIEYLEQEVSSTLIQADLLASNDFSLGIH